ncbi:unnamed protein product [Lampetra fluviatilis]
MTAGTACLNRWGHTTELATGTRRATYRAAGNTAPAGTGRHRQARAARGRVSTPHELYGTRRDLCDKSRPKRGDGGGGGEDDDDEGGGRRSGRERLASQRARDL